MITGSELVHGWAGPSGYWLRFARPGEAAAAAELLTLADVEIEDKYLESLDAGAIGAGLRRAIEFGDNAVKASIAEALASGDLWTLLLAQATMLVATDGDDQIVGALWALPPGRMLLKMMDEGHPARRLLFGMLTIAKIEALAVRPASRGQGLGTALLSLVLQLLNQARSYRLVFGSFHDRLGLASFYQQRGFTVLGLEQALSFELLNTPFYVGPGQGERLFSLVLT